MKTGTILDCFVYCLLLLLFLNAYSPMLFQSLLTNPDDECGASSRTDISNLHEMTDQVQFNRFVLTYTQIREMG